uniref:Uncharacterized protein n=1 Tax=Acrobeloides nanus TaxID=290746 RepID=A0A914CS86_9BILA
MHQGDHQRPPLSKIRPCEGDDISLTERSQRYKLNAAQKFMDLIAGYMAPHEGKEFLRKTCQKMFPDAFPKPRSEKFGFIMESLAERWLESENKVEARIVLSVVTPHVTFGEMLNYIPDLSDHQFRMSRKVARHITRTDEDQEHHRESYHKDRVDLFIRFITDPIIMIGLHYSRVRTRLSTKETIEILNVLRLHRKSEVIRLYYKFLKESNLENMKLSRSTLFRILDACAAKERKSVKCLDSYVALGMEIPEIVIIAEQEYHDVKKAIANIEAFRRHQLRAARSERHRIDLINNLVEDEAFVLMDWIQKWLPAFSRETQAQYFGKKQISWHCTDVSTVLDGKKVHHSFIHVMEEDSQVITE